MKRCPKCNRTYATGNQKFCTHDGGLLEIVSANQSDTMRIDSSQLKDTMDNAPTRAISRELTAESAEPFDPFKTVMARPQETTGGKGRNTQDLAPPSAPLSAAPTSASLPPLPSGSLPPSDSGTLPSLPSAPLASPPAGSGPIDSSELGEQTLFVAAPPAPHSQPLPAPPSQPLPSPRPAKRSKLPLVLGILAVLFILGVGAIAGVYFVVWPMIAKRTTVSPTQPTPQPSNEVTSQSEPTPDAGNAKPPANEPPPYTPPANAAHFVNSSNNLDGKLAENYVDFSFYYPRSWQKDSTAGVSGATNFAKVERRLPPDFTQENFAVGSYLSAGSAESDRAVFHTLAANLSSQFAKKFPEYRKVSEGYTKAGVYDGYEFRFEGMSRNTAKGDLKLWGRVIFVPPVDGSKNGVTLLMLATSLAPELKTVEDVGRKGELPMLLESFRFGKQ
jgi:hypothetical protein